MLVSVSCVGEGYGQAFHAPEDPYMVVQTLYDDDEGRALF